MPPELKQKTFELKQLAEDGTGTAKIATLNVIDSDGDVTRPGAFGEQLVMVMPAHTWSNPALGKARIYEKGNDVLADFMLNLKTDHGRNWYETLKFDFENGKPLHQWSYGYDAIDSERGQHEGQNVRFLNVLKVHEISPLILGAGVDTGTVNIKGGDKRATPRHHTATDDVPWSAATNRKRVRTDEAAGYYNGIYAWRDPEGDVGAKGTWKFIHHFVDEDGKAMAASTRACSNGIAVLNGARGGTTIPDADRKGVYNHIAGHLKDADLEAPELKQVASGKQFATEITETTQAAYDLHDRIEALTSRLDSLKTLRESEGRELSVARVKDLQDTIVALKGAEQLEALLTMPDEIKEQALHEAAVFERNRFNGSDYKHKN